MFRRPNAYAAQYKPTSIAAALLVTPPADRRFAMAATRIDKAKRAMLNQIPNLAVANHGLCKAHSLQTIRYSFLGFLKQPRHAGRPHFGHVPADSVWVCQKHVVPIQIPITIKANSSSIDATPF